MEKLKLNKKGQLGMSLVKTSMIAFLVLSVMAVAIVLSLTELRDVTEKIDLSTGALTTIATSTVVNSTSGAFPTGLSADTRACTLSITTWFNSTDASITYDAGNFTVVGCSIGTSATAEAGIDGYTVSVNGTFKNANGDVNDVSRNVTSGVTNFFDDTGTIFAILIVVVIILAIAIIITVVSRFGGGEGAGGISSGSGSNNVSGS